MPKGRDTSLAQEPISAGFSRNTTLGDARKGAVQNVRPKHLRITFTVLAVAVTTLVVTVAIAIAVGAAAAVAVVDAVAVAAAITVVIAIADAVANLHSSEPAEGANAASVSSTCCRATSASSVVIRSWAAATTRAHADRI